MLDVIYLQADHVKPIDGGKDEVKGMNSMRNYWRFKQIRAHHQYLNDIAETVQAYPDISYRYFIWPEEELLHEWRLLSPSSE